MWRKSCKNVLIELYTDPKQGSLWEKTSINWHIQNSWFLVYWYLDELAFSRLWNYSIASCVDKVMSNLLKTAPNTLKLGAFVNGGLYGKTGIDWVNEKLWFLVCGYINALSFKFLLNHLNLSFVKKVMVVLLQLRRLNWNWARLCSILIFGTLLCESCFVP